MLSEEADNSDIQKATCVTTKKTRIFLIFCLHSGQLSDPQNCETFNSCGFAYSYNNLIKVLNNS